MKPSGWFKVTRPVVSVSGFERRQYGAVGFPGGSSGKEPVCQCRKHERCGFDP